MAYMTNEENIVYRTSEFLDLFDPIEEDNSIINYDYALFAENTNFVTNNSGILSTGQRAQFMVNDSTSWMIPGRAFIIINWVPFNTGTGLPVVSGDVAVANCAPFFESIAIQYGNSTIENCGVLLHQKALMKNLLRFSGDESYSGSLLHFGNWCPDSGCTPALIPGTVNGGLLSGPAFTTPGQGINTLTAPNNSGIVTFTDSTQVPAVPLTTTLAGTTPFNIVGAATGAAAGHNVSAVPLVPSLAWNPAYNIGWTKRQEFVQSSMSQPPGSAWLNLIGTSNTTVPTGMCTSIFPLWQLSDVFEFHDQVIRGGPLTITLNVNSIPSMALQTANGSTANYVVKVMAANLFMPVVKVDLAAEARLLAKLTENPRSQWMYEKCDVYNNTITVNNTPGAQTINWIVASPSARITKIIFAFRYSNWYGGTNQSQNSMVFQPLPVTNLIDAYITVSGERFPSLQTFKMGAATSQTGPGLPYAYLLSMQNRIRDLEGSSPISWSQYSDPLNGCYSLVPFDLRYAKGDTLLGNGSKVVNFFATLQLGANVTGGSNTVLNNTPVLPCLPSAVGTGSSYATPTSSLLITAWLFTEQKASAVYGAAERKISILT